MDPNQQVVPRAVDLLAPSNRFQFSSRLYGRLHRSQLFFRKYWWVPVLVFAVVLIPLYVYTAATPAAFQSKARMWLMGKLNLREDRLYTEELLDYLGAQAELLRSPTVQARAFLRLQRQLPERPPAPAQARGGWAARSLQQLKKTLAKSLSGAAPATEAEAPPLPYKVKVTEASKTSIIELRASGPDPVGTRKFLDCLMQEYLVFKKETRETTSERTLASASGQLNQLAAELKAQQAKLHAFQSSNNVVFLQEQGNSAGSYLALLNRQLATFRTELQLLQRLQPEQWMEIQAAQKAGAANDPLAVQDSGSDMPASLAGPQAELFKANQQMQLLKSKREELGRFLQPSHPKILKLDAEIATQEKVAQISRNEALRQLATRRGALDAQIKNLEAAFGEWDLKALDASRKMADYDRLRQDLQRLQASYDRLLGVIQTVDVSRTVDQDNFGVLEPASVARAVPRMQRNMLAGLAASVLLSVACLYFLGLFDDRFASLAELNHYLSCDVLGQVPSVTVKSPPKGQLELSFLEKQRFEFLESFRNIRSSLLYMGNGRARPKTILLTSSVPEEGKSTIALYLAATMALGGSRVLLVDADMRRGKLHRFCGAKASPGLAEILNEESTTEVALVSSAVENLFLLPVGLPRRNPGELVLSGAWDRLMHALSAQFDFILIDSPPLLATDDAAVLAPKVDGVLMVVRGAFTSARMASRALQLLQQRHARVLGLVFNRAVSSAYEAQYYRYYGRGYHWRPQDESAEAATPAASKEARAD